MAKSTIRRIVSLIWDKDAAQRLEDAAEASLERAGKHSAEALDAALKKGGQKGATALTGALQREYKHRMARLSQQMAEGAIDEKQFRKEGEKAAKEFNAGLSSGIKRLRASEGGLTDAQYVALGSRFKTPRGGAGGGMAAGAMLGRLAGPLAGVLTVGAAIREGGEAIAAADRLETAVRKLGGTAKLTGVDLEFLERTSTAARESFKLSVPVANDLTSEVVKLTERAGDISKTSDALAAFLDIGAARGMGAEATLQAVQQAILGIDEGTDKLFGKNPSTLYKEYADRIGESAGSLTDQQKALALLDATMRGGERTRSSYLDYLQSEKGLSEQAAQKLEERRAALGEQLKESRRLADQLKVELYPAFADLLTVVTDLVMIAKDPIIFTVNLISKVTGPLADYFRWGNDLNRRSDEWWNEHLGIPIPGADEGSAPAVATGPSIDARHTGLTGSARARMELAAQRRMMASRMGGSGVARPLSPETSDAEKRTAEARITAMDEHLRRWAQSQDHYDMLTAAVGGAGRGDPAMAGAVEVGETEFDRYLKILPRIHSAAEEAARGMSDAFQDAFALMLDEGITVGNFFEGLARSTANAVGQILAEYAAGKAKEHFAAAIGAAAYMLGFGATGQVASASLSWAAAAEHTAAGMAWSALSGASAAGGQAARSRAPGSTYDAGLSTAQGAATSPGQVYIEIDPFNPANPVHVHQIGKAMDLNVRLAGRPGWSKG